MRFVPATLLSLLIALCALPGNMAAAPPAGWAGPESLKHTEAWAKQQPQFQLTHKGQPVWQDNQRVRVCQWEDVRTANRGTFPPNIAQPIGDCSSRGTAHGIENTIAGQSGTFRRVAPNFLYGAARVWVAKGLFGRGDGCNVAFLAKAASEYGVIFQDDPGVPAYNGTTGRDWGWRGPPESLKALAAQRKVNRVALLKSVADVRDAVVNRFGVATGGRWGTSDGNRGMYQRDGRWFARRDSSWAHVVCIDGYDGNAPSGPCYHITNSWGENHFPAPIDGSPAGGYWVTEADIAFMVNDQDTWAFSDVDGFPARIDLSPLRPKRPQPPGAPAVRPNPDLQPQAISRKESFDVPDALALWPGGRIRLCGPGSRLLYTAGHRRPHAVDRHQLGHGLRPGCVDRRHRPTSLHGRELPDGTARLDLRDRHAANGDWTQRGDGSPGGPDADHRTGPLRCPVASGRPAEWHRVRAAAMCRRSVPGASADFRILPPALSC